MVNSGAACRIASMFKNIEKILPFFLMLYAVFCSTIFYSNTWMLRCLTAEPSSPWCSATLGQLWCFKIKVWKFSNFKTITSTAVLTAINFNFVGLTIQRTFLGILPQKGHVWVVQLEFLAYESALCCWSLEEPVFQRHVDVVDDPLWLAADFFLAFPPSLTIDSFNCM